MEQDEYRTRRARELRKELTPTEKRLWYHLRGRRFNGFKFRRQTPILGYIADFYCAELRLIIELDGESHVGREEADRERQRNLESQGFVVLRISDAAIYDDIDTILEWIWAHCKTPGKADPSPPAPSPKGRGEKDRPELSRMPTPERMLTTLKRATEFVRATPGRAGHFVELRDCSEVLVAGDLHGHIANFQVILKAADLANHPARHLVLQEVVHSAFRYPTGGDKSHQLLDLFAALKCQYPTRVHLLPGNHELAQMTGRPIGKGNESQNEVFVEGIKAAYGTAWAEIEKAYYELLRALPLAYRTPNRVFLSHTLIPGKQLNTFHMLQLKQEAYADSDYAPGGVAYGITWGRDTSQETADEFLRIVDADLLVSGHIPTDTGHEVPNSKQLIVDCSASPAAYVLFPTDKRLTLAELLTGVVTF